VRVFRPTCAVCLSFVYLNAFRCFVVYLQPGPD